MGLADKVGGWFDSLLPEGWSDVFLPDTAQTYAEAQANLEAEKQKFNEALQRRMDDGTISPDDADADSAWIGGVTLDNQDLATAEAFFGDSGPDTETQVGISDVLLDLGIVIALGAGMWFFISFGGATFTTSSIKNKRYDMLAGLGILAVVWGLFFYKFLHKLIRDYQSVISQSLSFFS